MDTEKITINATVVDLGQIDVLIDQGLYASRADFIRTAIRRQLDSNEPVVRDVVTREKFVTGAIIWGAKTLEEHLARGERIKISQVGLFKIRDDVTPELADAVFESIKVRGVLKAPPAVLERLKPKIDRVRG